MARPTTEELLEAVENAILAISTKGAKSYSINGRSYTSQDLSELRALRDDLKRDLANEAAASSGTGDGFFEVDFGC